MIEHGAGFKALSSIVFKPILAGLVALGRWPIADYFILQVTQTAILNPELRLILEDLKVIFGILISILVVIKLFLGISKMAKGTDNTKQ